MKPKIKTRITNLIAKLAGSPDYEPGIQPKEPIEFYLSDAIDGILSGGIGVTPLGVVTATGQMTTAQKKATRDNIGAVGTDELAEELSVYQLKPVVEVVIGATPSITPVANKVYECGELASLTIVNPPATGAYAIIFYSGAVATATVGIENFVAEANKRYKITVDDNYAVYDSWPYTPT